MEWWSGELTHPGRSFGSALEARLFDYLVVLENIGDIRDIQQQDHIYLTRANILYIADYKVFDINRGEAVWYEAKGFETPEWRIKRKLWLHYGPGILHIYKSPGKVTEILMPEMTLSK